MNERPVNFLSGSPLNRLSWLRTSSPFLNAVAALPATRFVLFRSGAPLTAYDPATSVAQLVRLSAESAPIQRLLGPTPYFGHLKEGYDGPTDLPILESARWDSTPVIFLGVQENAANDFAAGRDPAETARSLQGTAYFSIDASDVEESEADEIVAAAKRLHEGAKVSFAEARASTRGMSAFDAAVFAEARSMADWNGRNKFCPACGSPQYSLWAGWKLGCSSLLPWAEKRAKPCPTATGLHNFTHPRSDGVVIMAVVNEANDRILLGHNKKFPHSFYSTLAGFIEPGESFEDAVKREILEEAGIHVWNVRYHSSQPWPYPANLMVGFVATGDPSEPIQLDLDNELADAHWYTREEILAVLAHPEGTNMTRRDHATLAKAVDGQNNLVKQAQASLESATTPARAQNSDEPLIRVPPQTAIAGVLIADWAHGRFPSQIKGHL